MIYSRSELTCSSNGVFFSHNFWCFKLSGKRNRKNGWMRATLLGIWLYKYSFASLFFQKKMCTILYLVVILCGNWLLLLCHTVIFDNDIISTCGGKIPHSGMGMCWSQCWVTVGGIALKGMSSFASAFWLLATFIFLYTVYASERRCLAVDGCLILVYELHTCCPAFLVGVMRLQAIRRVHSRLWL